MPGSQGLKPFHASDATNIIICETVMYIHRYWHLWYVIAAPEYTKICLQMIKKQ